MVPRSNIIFLKSYFFFHIFSIEKIVFFPHEDALIKVSVESAPSTIQPSLVSFQHIFIFSISLKLFSN